MTESINFTPDYGAKENSSDIKVIGVGGAGSNAVQHMYLEGIQGVDYLVCNTDKCHLNACKVPDKLLLGTGLGAGAKPEVARALASSCEDKIKEFIGDNTKMLFIAAGMGKGTGTGASPVIARIAKDMGILTVGVVTEPFKLEGKRIKMAAESGIEEMSKYVDSLIIINNQNLMKYYTSLPINEAYGEVDDILKNAVKCIAEIITVTYGQNVDFNDVKSIMENSGKALLGIATAQGENRVQMVLDDVLNCPLLDNADISDAKNFLFFVTYGPSKQITMGELEVLQDRFEEMQSENVHVIWGHGLDESLGDNLKLSLVVTNFNSLQAKEEDVIYNTSETNESIYNSDAEHDCPEVAETQRKIDQLEAERDTQQPEPTAETETENEFFPGQFTPEPQIIENNFDFSDSPSMSDDYNNDDSFDQAIHIPAIYRMDMINGSQTKTPVVMEDSANASYFELKDDSDDVFFGFAD